MTIFFITGNNDKFLEAKAVIGELARLDIDLPELQDLDPRGIVKAKIREAFRHHSGPFIVEDTSLSLTCLQGLPGPLIKWFERTIGNDGLVALAERLGDDRAMATTCIGYGDRGRVSYFTGTLHGRIVPARGGNTFGWNTIFQPDGYAKTFGEMPLAEKHAMSMRTIALNKLKAHLARVRARSPRRPTR